MTNYTVSPDNTPIKFGLNGAEEVRQNIRTIVSTIMGTCPFYRQFGIDSEIIDLPTHAAAALLEVSIIDAIAEYEPRALVTGVEVRTEGERLIPTITFTLREEEEDGS
ncbi:Lysozyme [compost metagenome]